MKTNSTNKFFIFMFLILSASSISASKVNAQAINPFEEGTETRLNPQQIAEMKEWAQNSRASLLDLLDQIKSQTYRQAKETLIQGIRDAVVASAPKTTETLLRYVLNRSLKIVEKIDRATVGTSAPGVIDQEVRVLRHSAEMALEYYQSDIDAINGRASGQLIELPYATFGIRYAAFLMQVNGSLLNGMASYSIAEDALGYLMVDLAKDQNTNSYAEVKNKLYVFLQLHPQHRPTTSVEAVIQMHKVVHEYHLVVNSLNGTHIQNLNR